MVMEAACVVTSSLTLTSLTMGQSQTHRGQCVSLGALRSLISKTSKGMRMVLGEEVDVDVEVEVVEGSGVVVGNSSGI